MLSRQTGYQKTVKYKEHQSLMRNRRDGQNRGGDGLGSVYGFLKGLLAATLKRIGGCTNRLTDL
jgi:hypothetical protein